MAVQILRVLRLRSCAVVVMPLTLWRRLAHGVGAIPESAPAPGQGYP
jgi:hypothetical protein